MNTNREQVIIRTSIIGILANVFLAAFKAVVGILLVLSGMWMQDLVNELKVEE